MRAEDLRRRLSIEALEDRLTPSGGFFAVGAGAGGAPQVTIYNSANTALHSFYAFPSAFSGGVRVAVGDVNGDGVNDVVCAAGTGGGPQVEVIDGTKLDQVQSNGQIANSALIASFYAFTPSFSGGVNVAVADVNKDHFADIVVGADAGGGPEVRLFNGKDLKLLSDFYALPATFSGGVRVAAIDPDTNGASIVTAAEAGGGPEVACFNAQGVLVLADYCPTFPSTYTGGLTIAVGNTNGDARPDIVVGAGSISSQVVVVDMGSQGLKQIKDAFYAFAAGMQNGVTVGVQNTINGIGNVLAAGVQNGQSLLRSFNGMTGAFVSETTTFQGFSGGSSVGGNGAEMPNPVLLAYWGEWDGTINSTIGRSAKISGITSIYLTIPTTPGVSALSAGHHATADQQYSYTVIAQDPGLPYNYEKLNSFDIGGAFVTGTKSMFLLTVGQTTAQFDYTVTSLTPLQMVVDWCFSSASGDSGDGTMYLKPL
jgi:hypothetical protein